MTIPEMLDELLRKAEQDMELKKQFLETKKQENPLSAFCGKCRELVNWGRRGILCRNEKKHQRRR